MSASVNKVILVGNVGREPEERAPSDKGTIVTFSVATSESWKDKNSGERKDRTEWHNVVIFNDDTPLKLIQEKVGISLEIQDNGYSLSNVAEKLLSSHFSLN